MIKNKITNQSSIVQRKSPNEGSRHKFIKILCLVALMIMVSEMAMASDTTLAAQLDKIVALSSGTGGGNKNLVVAIALSIGLSLVMYQLWRAYCQLPTADDAKQTSKPEVTNNATSQQSNKPTTI